MKYGKMTFKQRWNSATDAADAHINRHGGQVFAAIGVGILIALFSGLPGVMIRGLESDRIAKSGGTVILNGIPLSTSIIAYMLVAGLGLVAGVLLYYLGLSLWFFFRQ